MFYEVGEFQDSSPSFRVGRSRFCARSEIDCSDFTRVLGCLVVGSETSVLPSVVEELYEFHRVKAVSSILNTYSQ